MSKYLSLEDQTDACIKDIKSKINKNNVSIALPILRWTIDKIELAYNEDIRIKSNAASSGKSNKSRYVENGHIYYAKLGRNIGSEQCGYRPVLVVQSKDGNATNNTVLVIPLTDFYKKDGTPKKVLGTHIEIDNKDYPNLKKKSIIKAEHINNISKNRLLEQVCELTPVKMSEVNDKIKKALDIK